MTDRQTDTGLDRLFLDRWSPRAYDGSAIPNADLHTILDAARWAPSSYNYQPWRLLYATRDSADWQRFLDILIPFNQSWAKDAGVLIFIVSETTMGSPDKPSHSHSFDAGAAWAQLALQSFISGYYAHGMVGFDLAKARTELAVPEGFRIEAAIAIGKQGDPATLPDGLREREVPSDRKPRADIAYPGNFRA
ncbi:nitroreductase family protein [Sphingobium sufflavum]|uniref:nitroreductase family protein n=1 Tax=Sphingobium sufflavum TaxID=1129547 RepID=UPI001F39BA6B|nr:nitroreductase family protein [Sphingobium sufflavum]MCE7795757.1 nitroreductase family protein [Sphingobium sufflavum]